MAAFLAAQLRCLQPDTLATPRLLGPDDAVLNTVDSEAKLPMVPEGALLDPFNAVSPLFEHAFS